MLRRMAAALLLRVARHFDGELSRDELERWVARGKAEADRLDVDSGRNGDASVARLWVRRVAEEGRIPKSPLPTGLGLAIDTLEDDDDCQAALELLLRHVEVRRDACLSDWAGVADAAVRDCERLGVAVLFARTSARTGDLRFVNAGLKMIDWFGTAFIRRRRRKPAQLRNRVRDAVRESLACLGERETS